MTAPAPHDASDEDLIASWRGGDEAAAAELVRRHACAVAGFLAASGAGEDVEDLVQEAFFRAFRRIDGFRGSASFRTWVMTIGANALRDLGRRRRRRTVLPLDERDIADGRGDPHDGLVALEAVEQLQRALAALPPMQRNVFLLRAQQGAEYEEIAWALGTTSGAARVHYHHAVRRLKAAIE